MAEPRELIHLGFQLFQPHAALEPWVQCYWVIDCPTCNPSFERVYPDGGSSLIFDLTAPDPAGTIFAANQAPQIMAVSGTLLGIRFQPTGAHQLLGLPMKELGGEVITRGTSWRPI